MQNNVNGNHQDPEVKGEIVLRLMQNGAIAVGLVGELTNGDVLMALTMAQHNQLAKMAAPAPKPQGPRVELPPPGLKF